MTQQSSAEMNINLRLPPELLTRIFYFLPITDLHNAVLVCRLTRKKEIRFLFAFQFLEGTWKAGDIVEQCLSLPPLCRPQQCDASLQVE